MTTWELAACVDGFNLANGSEPEVEAPSPEEFDEMLIKHGWVATATQH